LSNAANTPLLSSVLAEFTEYLDRANLLPKWKYLLDVVNCAGSIDEVKKGVYSCPDTGGAYSHRRAKFFGPYAEKQVSCLFEIDAVAVVDPNNDCRLKWNNTDSEDETLRTRAIEWIKEHRNPEKDSESVQVFLLSNQTPTCFKKMTSGGMAQSKIYFPDIANAQDDVKSLAVKLNGKSWRDFK
jgi:hypothetical protein